MKTVAVVGVGLIGGSFGLALRKAGFSGDIIGVSSEPAIAEGLEIGAISRRASLEEAGANADLVYLAQPIDRILVSLEPLAACVRPTCLVTDAGSTKRVIVEKAQEVFRKRQFLGGHPLAGKEQKGARFADPDLFRNRPYVLTPSGADDVDTTEFRRWLATFGARVIEMQPSEHDATVGLTSHLPQLLSTALASVLASQSNPWVHKIFGPGLLDMTRLALSPADVWTSILATNRKEVLAGIEMLITSLHDLGNSIGTDQLEAKLKLGYQLAHSLRTRG